MNFDDGAFVLVAQNARLGLCRKRKYRMRHGRHVGSRRYIEDIENKEVAYGMAFRKEAHMAKPRITSFYRQLIRSIADPFVLSAPTSYFWRPFRSFGDHFVLLATNPR